MLAAKLSPAGIGTRKESSLHRSLKFRYSGDEGSTETSVGEYICDGMTGKGEIIEVQTGSFAPLRDKVKKLAADNKVIIVHPIVVQKHIELYDAGGRLLHRRKSPRKGSAWDLFKALIYAPEFPRVKNLTIELALIDIAEKRVDDGTGSWRRKGRRIADKVMEAWRDSIILKKPGDYSLFIPFKKKEPFTVKEFGEKAGINTDLARKAVYVLAKMGLVEKKGSRGRAPVYERK